MPVVMRRLLAPDLAASRAAAAAPGIRRQLTSPLCQWQEAPATGIGLRSVSGVQSQWHWHAPQPPLDSDF
jgi:hypothetical protein